jgi:Holliday junction DNA helicase RuvA
MIGKLKGRVEYIFEDHCFLEISGVYYTVYCTASCIFKTSLGDDISFFIHTMLKDQIPVLYGFVEFAERELFVLLTSIQGVGPKMAMKLISEVDHVYLIRAIQQENPVPLHQVSGVGPKIAVRIISELRSNKKFFAKYVSGVTTAKKDDTYQLKQDAISALINMGFRRVDVTNAVDQLIKDDVSDLESIIRDCISKLSRW